MTLKLVYEVHIQVVVSPVEVALKQVRFAAEAEAEEVEAQKLWVAELWVAEQALVCIEERHDRLPLPQEDRSSV